MAQQNDKGPPRAKWGWPDTIHLAGLAIALHETFCGDLDKPYLLGLAGSMMLGARGLETIVNREDKS